MVIILRCDDLSIPESPFPPHASSRPRWGWRGLCWSCWRWLGRGRAPLGSKSLATDRRHRSPGVKLRQATYWPSKSVSINEALDSDFAYDRTSFSFWPIFLGPPNTCEKTETWMNIRFFFFRCWSIFLGLCLNIVQRLKAKRADWWKLLTQVYFQRTLSSAFMISNCTAVKVKLNLSQSWSFKSNLWEAISSREYRPNAHFTWSYRITLCIKSTETKVALKCGFLCIYPPEGLQCNYEDSFRW